MGQKKETFSCPTYMLSGIDYWLESLADGWAIGSAESTSKCCWPLRAVAPPHSAVISISAPAAGIAPPSLTTPAEIGIAQSVRPRLGNAGLQHVRKNFFRRTTSTWSSHFLTDWCHWSYRTRRSSTIYCSVPVPKPFSKSLAIRDTSAQRLASSARYIPGARSSG